MKLPELPYEPARRRARTHVVARDDEMRVGPIEPRERSHEHIETLARRHLS